MHLLVSQHALDQCQDNGGRDVVAAAVPVLSSERQPVIDEAKAKGALVQLNLDRRWLVAWLALPTQKHPSPG